MTARVIPVSKLSPPVRSWYGYRSPKGTAGDSAPRPRTSQSGTPPRISRLGQLHPVPQAVSFDTLWNTLMESLPDGVLVVTPALQLVYANGKAKHLCQQLATSEEDVTALPTLVVELCQQLLAEADNQSEPLVMEYQKQQGQWVRLRVQWLSCPTIADSTIAHQTYLLVLLEDCYETLQEELQLERKKYDLTEREAQIWMLLRQEYSYQEIANFLQISLNTVKTHVKNVYSKRRSCQDRQRLWYSR